MTELEMVIKEITLELLPIIKDDANTMIIEAMFLKKFDGYILQKKERSLIVYKESENERLFKLWLAAKTINGCTQRTIRFYHATVKEFLRMTSKNISEINANDIRGYMYQKQKKGVSLGHCNSLRRILSSFFTFLVDEEILRSSPMKKVPPFRAPKKLGETLSSEEIEKIRLACTTKVEAAVFEFMFSTACRASEMFALNRDDVDLESGRIVVFGKGKKERCVFLTPRAKLLLAEYLNERDDEMKALFLLPYQPIEEGKRFRLYLVRPTADRLRLFLNSLGKKAGVSIQPHKIRRSAATFALRKGMSMDQIRILLGHESINTTLIYAQTDETQLKSDHAKYLG